MYWLDYFRPAIYMDKNSMTSKRLNEMKNRQKFINTFVPMALEAMERYDIENLPPNCNKRVVKESLLWYGSVTFFEMAGTIWALPGMPSSDYTVNGNPTKVIVHGRNGFCEEMPLYIPQGDNKFGREGASGQTYPEKGKAVFVRENYLVYPFINHVMDFAYAIADTYRTLDVTRANMKKPYIITAEESIIESVKAWFNKRDNNEEYIVSSGVFPSDKITIQGFEQTPDNVRDCTGLIDFYYSKFREAEAISAAPATIDKKAEITIPELNQNQGAQEVIRLTVQNILQEELDFANECLGTDMRFVSNTEADMNTFGKEEEDVSGSEEHENVQ